MILNLSRSLLLRSLQCLSRVLLIRGKAYKILYKSGLPWFLWSLLQIPSAFLTLIKLPWLFPVLPTSQEHSHFRTLTLMFGNTYAWNIPPLAVFMGHSLSYCSQALCFQCGILWPLYIKLQAPSSLALHSHHFCFIFLWSLTPSPIHYRFYFVWVCVCLCVCVCM